MGTYASNPGGSTGGSRSKVTQEDIELTTKVAELIEVMPDAVWNYEGMVFIKFVGHHNSTSSFVQSNPSAVETLTKIGLRPTTKSDYTWFYSTATRQNVVAAINAAKIKKSSRPLSVNGDEVESEEVVLTPKVNPLDKQMLSAINTIKSTLRRK